MARQGASLTDVCKAADISALLSGAVLPFCNWIGPDVARE